MFFTNKLACLNLTYSCAILQHSLRCTEIYKIAIPCSSVHCEESKKYVTDHQRVSFPYSLFFHTCSDCFTPMWVPNTSTILMRVNDFLPTNVPSILRNNNSEEKTNQDLFFFFGYFFLHLHLTCILHFLLQYKMKENSF